MNVVEFIEEVSKHFPFLLNPNSSVNATSSLELPIYGASPSSFSVGEIYTIHLSPDCQTALTPLRKKIQGPKRVLYRQGSLRLFSAGHDPRSRLNCPECLNKDFSLIKPLFKLGVLASKDDYPDDYKIPQDMRCGRNDCKPLLSIGKEVIAVCNCNTLADYQEYHKRAFSLRRKIMEAIRGSNTETLGDILASTLPNGEQDPLAPFNGFDFMEKLNWRPELYPKNQSAIIYLDEVKNLTSKLKSAVGATEDSKQIMVLAPGLPIFKYGELSSHLAYSYSFSKQRGYSLLYAPSWLLKIILNPEFLEGSNTITPSEDLNTEDLALFSVVFEGKQDLKEALRSTLALK